TAGKAPDAAVNHADAEAVRFGGVAAGAEAAAAAHDLSVAHGDVLRAIAREADVSVRAAEALRLAERGRRPLLVLRIVDRRRLLARGIESPRECRARQAGDECTGA